MNFRISTLLLFILICNLRIARAQSDIDHILERIIEFIAENSDQENDYSEITDRLILYSKNPIDVNSASAEQLGELLFLSAIQIENLINYRKVNGPFQDVLEIQNITGLEIETAEWLSKFVIVKNRDLLENLSAAELLKKSTHDLMLRVGQVIQRQTGFNTSNNSGAPYAGSPLRLFARYRYDYEKRISASINMEKDAGERFLTKSGAGFDFYSGSIAIRGEKFFKKLVIGDFSLQFGQGLAMWSGLGFGKGAGLTAIAKPDRGLQQYSSANESAFLRGFAAAMGGKRIVVTPFVSYRKIDASMAPSGNGISSLPVSGLHRTVSEIKNQNAARQFIYGLNAQYRRPRWRTGFTIYNTRFDKPMLQSDRYYQKFDFSGQDLVNMGFNYNYSFRNSYVFGEAAHSLRSGYAFVNGWITSLSSKVSVAILHRSYGRNYHSFFNGGISEATEARNEKGLYAGSTIRFSNKLELSTWVDSYTFPWLKFRVDAPSSGYEFLTQLMYTRNKSFKVIARFRQEIKQENAESITMSGGLDDAAKHNYRLELAYKMNSSFSLRTRMEMSSWRKNGVPAEYGFLGYQDIIYNPLSSRLSWNARFAVFDVSGFNARVYAYENDVLYGYSVPAYQNSGIRAYFNARYTLRRGMDIWLRYAILTHVDQETIGSGNDEIDGNRRSDFRIQIRLQF